MTKSGEILGQLWTKYVSLVDSNEVSMFQYSKYTEWGNVPYAEGFFEWLAAGQPESIEELR